MAAKFDLPGPGAAEFTEEQIAEFKEAFEIFACEDDSDLMPAKCLMTWLRALGQNPPKADVENARLLQGDSATLDFEQVVKIMSCIMQEEDPDQEIRAAFDMLDKDGTGLVDMAEIRKVLDSLGETFGDRAGMEREPRPIEEKEMVTFEEFLAKFR